MLTFTPDGIRRYRNTRVDSDGHSAVVTLHSTEIVDIGESYVRGGYHYSVTLDSGGWRTVPTKKRINEVAQELGLDFCVFQRKGEWWIDYNGTQTRFVDRTTFSCNRREA